MWMARTAGGGAVGLGFSESGWAKSIQDFNHAASRGLECRLRQLQGIGEGFGAACRGCSIE
jgi:hypothetical protein